MSGEKMGQTMRTMAAAMMLLSAAGMAAQTAATSPPAPSPQQQMREMMEFFRAHYAKREYRVAMRDGAKLYTVVYTPIAGSSRMRGRIRF
jgi:predicted acyl esterase